MINSLKKIYVASMLMASFSLTADLPEPYLSVNLMPQTPYFVQDGYLYYSLLNESNGSVVIDVESQDGGVARFIAQQKPNLPAVTKIYSVSGWQSMDAANKHLFQKFLSNVVYENTADLITPIRMSSKEAAAALNIRADFISVVGGNDQNGIYNDILTWYPHLSDTGIICGNNWNEDQVQIGVTRAAAALDLHLKISDNFWYFQKG